jgi:phosphoribosyl 1,2-cyclic phosphodiesterase
MNSRDKLRLKFWGVRGSIPTPDPGSLGYGGNTSCLEVRYKDEIFVFDAGTGARLLGRELQRNLDPSAPPIHLFFTHFHWDHIQGVPFFNPLYDRRSRLLFYSACSAYALEQIIRGQMRKPYFPVDLPGVQAECNYEMVQPGGLRQRDLSIIPFPLFHPDGATGYRIETPDAVIVHASDYEHGSERHERILCEYASRADVLIYDAQYTPEEYQVKRGWGHSTWRAAAEMADRAGVSKLVLFHHDPDHDDTFVTKMARDASSLFTNTVAAREGSCIEL